LKTISGANSEHLSRAKEAQFASRSAMRWNGSPWNEYGCGLKNTRGLAKMKEQSRTLK
jgi:hypothetical protein